MVVYVAYMYQYHITGFIAIFRTADKADGATPRVRGGCWEQRARTPFFPLILARSALHYL